MLDSSWSLLYQSRGYLEVAFSSVEHFYLFSLGFYACCIWFQLTAAAAITEAKGYWQPSRVAQQTILKCLPIFKQASNSIAVCCHRIALSTHLKEQILLMCVREGAGAGGRLLRKHDMAPFRNFLRRFNQFTVSFIYCVFRFLLGSISAFNVVQLQSCKFYELL